MNAVTALLSCMHPIAKAAVLVLGVSVALYVLAALVRGRPGRGRVLLSLPIAAGLGLLMLWLGSYAYSPLAFTRDNAAVLRGFLVTRQGRANEPVSSGDVILLSAGSPAAITLLSDLPDLTCNWSSLNGGAWDDPYSCDTAYLAPAAGYDILTVNIQPGCSLPLVRGRIRISIMP